MLANARNLAAIRLTTYITNQQLTIESMWQLIYGTWCMHNPTSGLCAQCATKHLSHCPKAPIQIPIKSTIACNIICNLRHLEGYVYTLVNLPRTWLALDHSHWHLLLPSPTAPSWAPCIAFHPTRLPSTHQIQMGNPDPIIIWSNWTPNDTPPPHAV